MRRVYVLVGLVLALTVGDLTAQIQPGRVYNGGEQISEPQLGLTLTLPAGWRGALSPEVGAFVMESLEGGGAMMIIADEATEAEARAEMGQPMDLGGGVVLTPTSEIREIASGHLSATYDVRGMPTEVTGTIDVRFTESGLGVAFVLLSPPASTGAHREVLREFALSLGVTEPVAPATTGDEWEPYLRGRYLARFYTGSSYTESTELWLCSDGTFYFNDQSGGFGAGASGAYQGTGSGRWSATGAGATGTLNLQWSGGGTASWGLEYDYDEDRLYVNGQRMLRGANERCG